MSDFPDSGGALVTGGIGAAVARQLAGVGVNVVVTYNSNEAAAAETVSAVEAAGQKGQAVKVDLQ